MLYVTNAIRDSIVSDVTMFVECRIEIVDEKTLCLLMSSVERQGHTIFEAKVYLPEGVYIRHGAATVPASESSILKMIQATSGDSDETARSIKRQLTFDNTKTLFKRRDVAFSKTQMHTLHLIGKDGTYTK